ncbi:MAG: S-layer homology domain-containing protein, partial [bacterium]|nr:S-layer homology domain-containing protein [bacterium]
MRTRTVLTVFLLVMGMLAVGTANATGFFTDDDTSVHVRAIEAIADEGITLGCNPPANTLYCPSSTVTREQMASFLVRALDLPAGSSSFADIDSSIHKADIAALASAGITAGCNPPANSLYCPSSRVTREQMASFLVRALDLPAGSSSFTDIDSSIHKADIAALAS